MSSRCTAESFAKDVKAHEMTIVHDSGVHRHLRFGRPGDGNMYFMLTTWPGHLCFSGDMGCFVFSRIDDMFRFFRGRNINPGYWSEKLEAVDRADGFEQYSSQKFRGAIAEWLDDIGADAELRREVEEEILGRSTESEQEAVNAAISFEHKGRAIFQDFWEVNLREYGFRFIWCCYAIVWGIAKYDKETAVRAADAKVVA